MAYQFQNASILVIDDMKPMLALVRSILDVFGFRQIYLATDPDEGFKLLCEHNPDIVLTDWLMEPYDGIELIRRIRRDPKVPNRFVPVVMMSGYSHRIRVEEARDIGVTEFLVKPFRARDLYVRLEQLIERPRRFVDSGEFFGPDRRRRKGEGYEGPRRRERDEKEEKEEKEDDSTAHIDAVALFRKLRDEARNTAANMKYKPGDKPGDKDGE